MKPKTITIAELKARCLDHLMSLPDETEVYFGAGDLTFYRPKTRLYRPDNRTPQLVQLEFNELYEVTHDGD